MKARSDQRRFWRETFPKFLEAAAIWTVVAAAIGWLTWKEINRRPLAADLGRPLVFISEDAYGISKRSPLVCQGLNVGEILSVQPQTGPDGALTIRMEGSLDPKFKGWNFEPEARIESGGFTATLTGAPIQLVYAGELTAEQEASFPEEGQTFRVLPPDDTGKRIQRLLGDIEKITAAFTATVPPEELPPGWDGEDAPTRAAVIADNLLGASLALEQASVKLDQEMDATNDDTVMARLRGMKDNVDEISAETVALLTRLQATSDAINGKLDDVIGRSPAERARLRREFETLLETSEEMVLKVDNLLPRVGDTFIGRLLIRKPRNPEEPEPDPARQ